jgi:DNA-binding transcriptional MerR regulator
MNDSLYTIGELARISGIAVRRIRFYSDAGLLPPVSRTAGNYRVYSDDDVARLQLIRALRDTGVGLDVIRKLLERRLSVGEVLRLRLESLEAELVAKQRIANCLRATLRSDEPTEADLRRLWNMTQLTRAQLRDTVERVFDSVATGTVDADWTQRMIDMNTPELPAQPTPRQIDAWNEITAMLDDRGFLAQLRADTADDTWSSEFDPAAYAAASDAILAKVREAMANDEQSSSPAGLGIAREWLRASALAMRREPNDAFLEWHLAQYRKYHGRSTRYQQLLAILRGDESNNAPGGEWLWINEAMTALLKQSR